MDNLISSLAGLQYNKKILFVVLTCEKLYDNYVIFSETERWGNPEVLQDIIAFFYEIALDCTDLQINRLKKLQNQLDEISPDLDDFPSLLGTFAFDACCAFDAALLYLEDDDINHIVEVATFATDTVDAYVQEKEGITYNSPEQEERIQSDNFMISELERQRSLVEVLIEINEINEEVVRKLRENNNKQSLIDISLLS